MIADNRGTALGIADKDGGKDKADIHDNAVSGHAIGTAQAEQLPVVQRAYQRGGQIRHQFTGAVGAGLK